MITIDEKNARFDARETPHLHFKCASCGEIFDFDLPPLQIESLKDYDISDIVTIEDAVRDKLLNLSVEQAVSAVKVGLIPCIDNYIMVPWFTKFLKGELEYPLPKRGNKR